MANKDILLQLNKKYKVVNAFKSVKDASERLGIHRSLIYECLQGRIAWTHNFTFIWKSDWDELVWGDDEEEEKEETKPVDSNDFDRDFVQVSFKDGAIVRLPSKYVESIICSADLRLFRL